LFNQWTHQVAGGLDGYAQPWCASWINKELESMVILVIDDDRDIRRLVTEILEDHGYDVLTAPDGTTGLRAAQQTAPDLVICDERMPGLLGHQVCQQLYTNPHTATMPVIMMSAHSYEVDQITPNCVMRLRKPLTYEGLIATVQDVIGDP
jgi:DNA-binding response OmpR family regulator